MLSTVMLVCFRDEMTGELGLGLREMPRNEETNAAHEGFTIAHDLFEHINGPQYIGTIDDELQALGALWYVRGESGELNPHRRSYYTPHQSLAGDVSRMFVDIVNGAYCSLNFEFSSEETPDVDFSEIIDYARGMILQELDEEQTAEYAAKIDPYLRAVQARMRQGYIKAEQKYRDQNISALFWKVAEAVQPYCKAAEYEGAEYVLTYGFRDGKPVAYCEEYYPEFNDESEE